ncbi:MAG: circadian clock protein KaiB [Deltaproteobacteria bacterium]|nr:circadian clock protein KaiB [Deltaproteobacteria bacterium]
MKPSKNSPATACEPFKFILFVAGQELNSVLAGENLRRLCQEHLPGRHSIEIIDVFQNMEIAFKNNIIITPTLIKVAPDPTVTIFGNLSDSKKLMHVLRP